MRKIKFKINGDVVFADNRELTLDEIDLVKEQIIKLMNFNQDIKYIIHIFVEH